jgi:hypothetical protein
MLDAFIMRGGPHDGFSTDPSGDQSHRETLFQISFVDGASYARAGRVERDAAGTLREVFEFDDHGHLVETAKQRFTTLP